MKNRIKTDKKSSNGKPPQKTLTLITDDIRNNKGVCAVGYMFERTEGVVPFPRMSGSPYDAEIGSEDRNRFNQLAKYYHTTLDRIQRITQINDNQQSGWTARALRKFGLIDKNTTVEFKTNDEYS